MKALIIAVSGVQDVEFAYPFYRLQEAGYEVDVAASIEYAGYEGDGTWWSAAIEGIGGLKFAANRGLPIPGTPHPDLLVIPGGVKAMEKLRQEAATVDFIREYHKAGRVVAAICSGVQMLIEADLVRGRHAAIYPAFRKDLENAGGIFVDMPAVVDDRLVTSSHYKHLGPWMAAALIAVNQ